MNTPIDSNSITSKIIRFSAHNPLLILVITGIMLIISYYSIKEYSSRCNSRSLRYTGNCLFPLGSKSRYH
jgi:predicted RND superfamily exporter protein